MRNIKNILFIILFIPFGLYAKKNPKDTIIIEPNGKTKIIIYSETLEDLKDLQNYDVNQMIRDIANEVNDSTQRVDMEKEKDTYISRGVSGKNGRVKLKIGGVSMEVDTREVESLDEHSWENREKKTYEVGRNKRTTHHFNVDIGTNNWIEDGQLPNANNKPYAVKPWGSWYVGLNSVNKTEVAGPLFLEWGFGFDWYNWKLEDPNYKIQEGKNNIEFVKAPVGTSGEKSKLTASYINVRLVPMLDFSQGRKRVKSVSSDGLRFARYSKMGFRVGVGAYAGYRISSHTKFVHTTNGDRDKDKKWDNFYLTDLRYGLRGQVGWKGLELFVNYDLNEVFNKGKGPAGSPGLNAISFGVTF